MQDGLILVPLDGSAQSHAAIPYAVAIAEATGRPLRLLTVIEPELRSWMLQPSERDSDITRQFVHMAERYLSHKVAALAAEAVKASSSVVVGTAPEEILRAAEGGDAGMITMATHGYSGLQRWALGSVADKVMRLSPIPTLLVRPGEEESAVRRVELHRLLVPLDGSPLAEAAIAPAADLARQTGATLELLRVEPWVSASIPFVTEGAYVPNLAQMEDEAEAAAKEYIETARGKVPRDVPCTGLVLRGPVGPTLEDHVEEQRIDLVVMSTHGRGGLMRFVLGSKADGLVRAGVPTLLIRPAGRPRGEEQAREGAAAR